MPVMPRDEKDWTVDDLDRLPDDGLQYELLDGVLLVTPAPVLQHQRVAGRLYAQLLRDCPASMEPFIAPLDWRPDQRTSLQPDVLVARVEDLERAALHRPLALAVEVLSPSTRRKDQVFKRSKYEEAGVAGYWLIDPEAPSVLAYELRDGRYLEVGRAQGDEELRLELPFPFVVMPSALTRAR